MTARSPSSTGRVWPLVLITLPGLPLAFSAWSAMDAGMDIQAWRDLLAYRSTWGALVLSAWTGLAAACLSVALAAWILARSFPGPRWTRLVRVLGPMLAVPHAAFGIGLVFLIAPSGWLLRAFSPWASGFTAPPPWSTSQDPWGLGLIAVLVAKEVPFLLWAAASQLQRADVAQRFTLELQVARSMGYGAGRAWWRVVWPQLWPRLRWPMLAVLAYSLTVVDVALVDITAVNGTARVARFVGWLASRLQTGQVGTYAVLFVVGALVVLRLVAR